MTANPETHCPACGVRYADELWGLKAAHECKRPDWERIGRALLACEQKYSTVALVYHDAYCEWSLGLDYGRAVPEDCAKKLWTDDDDPSLADILEDAANHVGVLK